MKIIWYFVIGTGIYASASLLLFFFPMLVHKRHSAIETLIKRKKRKKNALAVAHRGGNVLKSQLL